MKDSFKFDYFYGSQAEQFSFFRLPKILIRDARFKKISSDAKILYGIMLDRMSLSRENKWMDQNNRVYIIFTVEEIAELMNCGTQKAVKVKFHHIWGVKQKNSPYMLRIIVFCAVKIANREKETETRKGDRIDDQTRKFNLSEAVSL